MAKKQTPAKRRRSNKPKPLGRPTTCTPAVTAAICRDIAIGVSFRVACEANGVAESTGHSWMLRAEQAEARASAPPAEPPAKPAPSPEDDAPFIAFSRAVTRARANGVIGLHKLARAGGKGASQATWLLERRFREDYGPVNRFEHSGPNGEPIKTDGNLKVDMTKLSDDELKQLAEGGGAATAENP